MNGLWICDGTQDINRALMDMGYDLCNIGDDEMMVLHDS